MNLKGVFSIVCLSPQVESKCCDRKVFVHLVDQFNSRP